MSDNHATAGKHWKKWLKVTLLTTAMVLRLAVDAFIIFYVIAAYQIQKGFTELGQMIMQMGRQAQHSTPEQHR